MPVDLKRLLAGRVAVCDSARDRRYVDVVSRAMAGETAS
jgi:hypothetical protein